MTDFSRFAVYFMPEPGPLAGFGAAWLGWDAVTGQSVAHPDIGALQVEPITRTPRKYGLHATLKPPFRLRDGVRPEAVQDAFDALCTDLAPVTLDGLALTRLGRFLALTAQGDQAALNALAARCVSDLDPLRAPLSPDELARRRAGGLTPAQEELLQRWGYPYVMEEFHFHITLSGRLDAGQLDSLVGHLGPVIDPLMPRPFRIDALCLAGEGPDGMFRLIRRQPLTGGQ